MTYVKARMQAIDLINHVSTAANPIRAIRMIHPWMRGYDTASATPGLPLLINGVLTFQRTAYSMERWARMKENYKEFAVTGVRIEYVPPYNPGIQGVFATNAVYTSSLMEKVANVDFNLEEHLGQTGVRSFNPGRKFKQWISFKKLAKTEHVDWQATLNTANEPYTRPAEMPFAWSQLFLKLTERGGDILEVKSG